MDIKVSQKFIPLKKWIYGVVQTSFTIKNMKIQGGLKMHLLLKYYYKR